MAKQIKSDPITERDLEAFVANDSDFAFKMKVLIRQFDIRAHKKTDNYHLALAVECRSLGPNNPLLVSAVPRTATESFHDVLEYRPTLMVLFARLTPSRNTTLPIGGEIWWERKSTKSVSIQVKGSNPLSPTTLCSFNTNHLMSGRKTCRRCSHGG
jgi:hypothetical protein